ncbi:hypothetical protein L227DRAFT_564967 [Lentinus tigrinus ALCF2SS1-6]|uniref:Uncharacterized protein n=1 Tax=Lentinus tigrinus ALCF2SS1-6 TaxID=1328759 RepID=A0A5C2S357_9APHY|nr:hypothetical protein L227DRAFT_564967 [Lentinus tigrinus ALCF2SS1-6]
MCSPELLRNGSDDVLFHRFPSTWVIQTSTILLPQMIADLDSKPAPDHDWPESGTPLRPDIEYLHRHLETLQAEFMNVIGSNWVTNPRLGDHLGRHTDTVWQAEIELARSGECEDDMDYSSDGTGSEVSRLQGDEDDGDGASGQWTQLDRDTVLDAFSSSRGGEWYRHTALWNSRDSLASFREILTLCRTILRRWYLTVHTELPYGAVRAVFQPLQSYLAILALLFSRISGTGIYKHQRTMWQRELTRGSPYWDVGQYDLGQSHFC